MKYRLAITAILLLISSCLFAQKNAGTFSLGTRNTISMFEEDEATGIGIGGQFRIQFSNRLNTEWYFDYITSKTGLTFKNDYHIGWSVMLYTRNNHLFDRLLQPYLIVGHCFDYSKVSEKDNKANSADRLSMATQAGLGTHINITPKLDCSLSGQYMLHFGKGIETDFHPGHEHVHISREDHSHVDGHLLFSLSFNYKFFKLWNKYR
ncbi:MAG: hypothetical protein HOP10_07140 [Chitinophagaceae bacterium]|nr:hypothetical protein [Chitinophagaceae bacterium]